MAFETFVVLSPSVVGRDTTQARKGSDDGVGPARSGMFNKDWGAYLSLEVSE